MKTMLIRRVNGRMRYYLIEMCTNLFDEWMVIRTYGSIIRATPVGQVYELYSSKHESLQAYSSWVDVKKKKGYLNVKEQGANQ